MAKIDLREKFIFNNYPGVLELLLLDRSSGKNLIWGTSNYIRFGIGYKENDYMTINSVVGHKNGLIKPRIKKSQTEQKRRSKTMAEVFTPAWICNKQNNLVDDAWFGYNNAFNIENDVSWEKTEKVLFKDKTWKEYIDEERLEVTCGEAPYLTSRYDVVTGNYIEPLNRIGLLDRKLRVISENINDEVEWQVNAELAFKRIYGFDFQGDNVLIARENLLFSYIEFYEDKFNESPKLEYIINIAKIISWNLWQMDGLKYVIPFSCHKEEIIQMSLFEEFEEEPEFCRGCLTGNNLLHNGIYSRIKDWRSNRIIRFIDLIK